MAASSRIFVRGLPPSITEADFRKHFSTVGPVTDIKLFNARRIGYVGYGSPQEAEKAVKYFNRTFIRMSKLAVEIARPVADAPAAHHQARKAVANTNAPSTAAAPSAFTDAENSGSAGVKRKRGSNGNKEEDPKLKEFLNAMQQRPESHVVQSSADVVEPTADALFSDNESDEEIQTITKKPKKTDSQEEETPVQQSAEVEVAATVHDPASMAGASDADWLRSRTNRTLDMADTGGVQAATIAPSTPEEIIKEDGANEVATVSAPTEEVDSRSEAEINEAKILESKRLFLRNLPYNTTEDNLRETFSQFASLAQVHVVIDKKTRQGRGTAYVSFDEAEDAVKAWQQFDGTTLNGRLLHILPSEPERNTQLDDYALSKLPLKVQQKIKSKREAATKTFNWNSLYMNADAVMSSVADRLGVSKAALLDPTSSDAAVKQAHAETHVIQETKAYFKSQGVNLDSFSKRKTGDTAILVKNFPYDASAEDLKAKFAQHGVVKRFLMPPSGTIAVVEFENAPEARAAFAALSYSSFKSSILFLEKAPADLFSGTASSSSHSVAPSSLAAVKPTAGDLLEREHEQDKETAGPTATLFVKGLNFSTTSKRLDEVFRPLQGFLSAKVKTKTDPKKPGQVLSMGFGFLEFRSNDDAQSALAAMNGYKLDGHQLRIEASHKGHDAAEQRKQEDAAKRHAAKRAKLVVKNLPFEATKKDLRSLFGAYGQLRSVRLPKKIGQSTRGFAFAEFTTPKEAESAMDALRNTHLLGRRLVIDYAAEDPEDAEEQLEKMQSKMGSQLNKVAVQNLMGDGRKKFTVAVPGGEES